MYFISQQIYWYNFISLWLFSSSTLNFFHSTPSAQYLSAICFYAPNYMTISRIIYCNILHLNFILYVSPIHTAEISLYQMVIALYQSRVIPINMMRFKFVQCYGRNLSGHVEARSYVAIHFECVFGELLNRR